MLGKEFVTTRINSIDPPTGFEVAVTVAGDIAESRRLDRETSEALSKFATINYRIGLVKETFEHLGHFKFTNPAVSFNIGFNEDNVLMQHKIYKQDAPEFIRTHRDMTLSLYSTHLNSDENTKEAAKEVLEYLASDSMPKE